MNLWRQKTSKELEDVWVRICMQWWSSATRGGWATDRRRWDDSAVCIAVPVWRIVWTEIQVIVYTTNCSVMLHTDGSTLLSMLYKSVVYSKTRLRLVCSHTLRLGMVMINWVLSERMGCLQIVHPKLLYFMLHRSSIIFYFLFETSDTSEFNAATTTNTVIETQHTIHASTKFTVLYGKVVWHGVLMFAVEWAARYQFREVNGKQELYLFCPLHNCA